MPINCILEKIFVLDVQAHFYKLLMQSKIKQSCECPGLREVILLHRQMRWSVLCLVQTLLYMYPLFKLICQHLRSRRQWCTSSWPCGCLLESKPGSLRIIILFLFSHSSSETADSIQIWHQRSVSPEEIFQEWKVRFWDFLILFFSFFSQEYWTVGGNYFTSEEICIHGSGLVLKQPAMSGKNK